MYAYLAACEKYDRIDQFNKIHIVDDEWVRLVTEILHLQVSVTDPGLTTKIAHLSYIEKCQAVTVIAEKSGHGWIPFAGEDIYRMP